MTDFGEIIDAVVEADRHDDGDGVAVLTSAAVTELIERCLLEDSDPGTPYTDAEGILHTYRFRTSAIEEAKPEIEALLRELPEAFLQSGGGGWSFLNACDDRHGRQWTGLHQQMEMLFCLGIAADLVVCPLPRNLWNALPGGMPYYVVKL